MYLNGGIVDSLTAWDSRAPMALKDLLCVLQDGLITVLQVQLRERFRIVDHVVRTTTKLIKLGL